MLGPDHRRDVTQRGVVRRIVVQHHDLQIDPMLVGLVDQSSKRGATEGGALMFPALT